MACTPLGRQVSMQSALPVVTSSIGRLLVSTVSTATVRPGSVIRYSFFSSAASVSAAFRAALPSATVTTAVAAVGMALPLLPPSADTRRSSVAADMARSSRPSSTSALARPLLISTPECPPTRPDTRTASVSPANSSRISGRWQNTLLPPAQPTVKIPSSSESIFSMVRPCRGVTSSTAAPNIPISSSVVSTTSSRGCCKVVSSSAASAMATAMPSSPPRVVPLAPTRSPSTKRSRPSLSMSLAQPASFSHTMSTWPCKITAGASS